MNPISSQLEVSLPLVHDWVFYPPGATFGPRRMPDWEFVFVDEGDAWYQSDQRESPAPVGSLVLCRPDTTDFFRWDAHKRTRHGYFHFQIERLPHDWPPSSTWPLVCATPEDGLMRALFGHIMAWNGAGNPLQCRLSIALLLTMFLSGDVKSNHAPPLPWPDAVERVWNYLHRRLDEDGQAKITLTELASIGRISEEHLCRAFKNATGHAPMETLRLARLDRAAALLARSNYGIAEIARLSGFADPFHFSRAFKTAYGQSPRALRRALEAGETPPLPTLLQRQTPKS